MFAFQFCLKHGCMFYVCKCCLDRLKKVGLITRYYDSRGPFRYWVRQVMMLCLLPAKHIRPTWVNHLSHQEFPELLSTREQLSLVEFWWLNLMKYIYTHYILYTQVFQQKIGWKIISPHLPVENVHTRRKPFLASRCRVLWNWPTA